MKLFEFPPTRSIRARWVLQELGVTFESQFVDLMSGANRSPEFLAINPAGKLPVLIDDGFPLTESIAIVLYLCEKHPESGLLPTDLRARAEVYRWLMFATTELEQPLWRISRHTQLYDEHERIPEDIELARRDFCNMAAIIESHLDGKQYLVRERFSVADIVCGYTLDWANEISLLDQFPNTRRYMKALYERAAAPVRIADALASVQGETS